MSGNLKSEILNYRALGRRIRNKRKIRVWSQDELAKQVGISLSFLGHIERGSRKASMDTLLHICKALNVMPNDLLYDSIDWGNEIHLDASEAPESLFDAMRTLLDIIEEQHGKPALKCVQLDILKMLSGPA